MHFNKLLSLMTLLMLAFALLPMITAVDTSVTTIGQDKCFEIVKACANCTFNNVTAVYSPNLTKTISNTAMSADGSEYNLTYCATGVFGNYIVHGLYDPDGVPTVWESNFVVNSDGVVLNNTFLFILFIIIIGLVLLGFAVKEGWFVVMGGLGLTILGIYLIINGIVGFKDSLLTQGLSMLVCGAGMFLTVRSIFEIMESGD